MEASFLILVKSNFAPTSELTANHLDKRPGMHIILHPNMLFFLTKTSRFSRLQSNGLDNETKAAVTTAWGKRRRQTLPKRRNFHFLNFKKPNFFLKKIYFLSFSNDEHIYLYISLMGKTCSALSADCNLSCTIKSLSSRR